MSTFGKSTSRRITQFEAIDNTPGPTAYDPAAALSLLNHDPNKHFGFLEKSNRWKSLSKDTLNEYEGGEYQESDLQSSTGSSRPSMATKKDHLASRPGEKEEVAKLKKEMERLHFTFEKQNTLHEKEMLMLGERCHKLDSMLQAAVKEKHNLVSSAAKRDKEIDELMKKQDYLRSNLEKAEKASASLREKNLESGLLQKKVSDLSKKQEKLKSMAKSATEVEAIQHELKSARLQLDSLIAEKAALSASIDQLKTDRKTFKTKAVELTTTLASMKEEWSAREAKYKEESKEMTKRLNQQDEKLQAQKADFKNVAEKLQQKCVQQKKELENGQSAFESQKQAYLSRINQLEGDLEVTERGLIEKDRQLDQLRQSTMSLEETTFKTQQSINDFHQQLRLVEKERDEFQARCIELEENRRALQLASEEKAQEQAHFESVILSLQSTIDQYQAEHESMIVDHAHQLGNKDVLISNLDAQLALSEKEKNLLSSELQERKAEFDHLCQTQSSLSSKLQSETSASSQRILALEEKLQGALAQIEAAEKTLAQESDAKQSVIEGLERVRNTEVDNLSKEINMLKIDKAELQRRVIEAQQAIQSDQDRSSEQMSRLYAEIEGYREKLAAASEDYQSLMNSRDSAIAQCNDTIAELEARFENSASFADQKMMDFKQKIGKYQAEIESLKESIEENQATANQVENNLKTEIDILEQSLHQHKIDLESMTMQYQQGQDTLRSLDDFHKSEKSTSSVQIQRLTREVVEKESANERLRAQVNELNSKISEEAERLRVLNQNHSKSQTEVDSRLAVVEHELKKTEQELGDAQNSYVLANQNVLEVLSKLVETRHDYYGSLETISDLKSECNFQKIDIEYLKSDLESCQTDLRVVEDDLLEERQSRIALESLLKSALGALANAGVDSVPTETGEVYDQFLAIREENSLLKERLASASLSNAQLRTDLLSAQLQLGAATANSTKLAVNSADASNVLVTAVFKAMEHSEDIWADLSSTTLNLEKSLEENESEKANSRNLALLLEQAKSDMDAKTLAFNGEICSYKAVQESLESEVSRGKENLEVLSHELHSVAKERDSLEAKFVALNAELQAKNNEIEEHALVIRELNSNLLTSEGKVKELTESMEATIKQHQEALQGAQDEIQQLQSENSELQQKLMNEGIIVADLNASYLESQHTISSLNQSLAHEKTVLMGKLEEIADLEARTQDLGSAMSEMLVAVENSDKVIDELTAKESELRETIENERISYQSQISQMSEEFSGKEAMMKQAAESVNSALQLTRAELEQTRESQKEQNIAMTTQITSLQSQLVSIEAVVAEKETALQTATSDLSRAKFEHESAIVDLKVMMDSQEKQFNETKYQLQTEKTEALRNALFEKEALNEKLESLAADLKRRERKLEEQTSMNAAYEAELLRIKTDGKHEFGNLHEKLSELKAKREEDSRLFEKTVQEMSARLAEKNEFIHRMQSDLSDAHNIIERSDIRLSNEVSNRELMIKALETKLKEKKKDLDRIHLALESSRVENQKLSADIEATVLSRAESQIQLATKDMIREMTELQRQLAEREHDEDAFVKEIDRLQILLQEARQNAINEKENFDMQLQLLEQRGKLKDSEAKKIGDLNAELFGHSNTRQKIKHVAQLKEENMSLREQSLSASRERDVAKRRILNLERELETFRSVGLFNTKKMSRVGRSFQESSKQNQQSQLLGSSKPGPPSGGESEKENSISMTGSASGGISFLVE